MNAEPIRRVLLVEIDMPPGSWSARKWEATLSRRLHRRWLPFRRRDPDLRPVVFGSISGKEVDAAFRKLRQLSQETEADATKADRVHSAHKALSFFRDMFPDRYWRAFAIGQSQERRQELLRSKS